MEVDAPIIQLVLAGIVPVVGSVLINRLAAGVMVVVICAVAVSALTTFVRPRNN